MYSTCMFCTRPLGRNEAIEHFPVGRRLAFDSEKGRLWVICPSCARWNLTPIEERWEAIEDAERLFRATKLRASTEHIGLARIREGTELVRVGRPQRPEIAAWRYGTQFMRRRHRHLIVGGAVTTAGAAAVVGGAVAGLGTIALFQLFRTVVRYSKHGVPFVTVARVRDPGGGVIRVTRRDLPNTQLGMGPDGALQITVAHGDGRLRLRGEQARQAATVLFPAVNRAGGTAEEVQTAVGRLERAGSAEQFLQDTARRGKRLTHIVSEHQARTFADAESVRWESGLLALSTPLSLAIEMALHEDQERRALEGELTQLEASWKNAEEIGAISDSLLLPRGIEEALARMRRGLVP